MKLPTLNFGLVASAVLGFGLIGLSSTPAAAQGTLSEQGWSGDRGVLSCPTGWTNSGDRNFRKCRPSRPDAKPAYIPAQRGQCATGYHRSSDFCLEGPAPSAPTQTAAAATVRKANALDRCPITYVSDERDLMTCNSRVANPPTVRAKGTAPCPAGSVEDWGIWCVSNYASLTRRDASYAAMDFNTIYLYSYRAIGSQQEPRQPFLPGATSGYSPAYITIFGRVKYDGSPMDAADPDAKAATPASTRPSRTSGTTTPQLRTAASFLCPETWVGGLAGTRNGNENMCYPQPGAAAAYPRQTQAETCAAGYVLSGTWCIAGNYVGSPGATQASAQTPPNCPAPSQASAAGQALGGLLGGRRGNSQAGAMLGGLLGAAAAGAAKPAGCP